MATLPEMLDLSEAEARKVLGGAVRTEAAVREVNAVLGRLPIVNVRVAVDADLPGSAQTTVAPGAMVAIVVDLVRTTRDGTGRAQGGRRDPISPSAFAPRFPKPQTEGWWLVCADHAADELKALRRVTVAQQTTVAITIAAPQLPGSYTFGVLLISDVYMGLDQEYAVHITVAAAPVAE